MRGGFDMILAAIDERDRNLSMKLDINYELERK